MPVITKRQRNKKSTFKSHPYPENIDHENQEKTDFYFNPTLKTSAYSDKQHIEKGGNPVFEFPIPVSEAIRSTVLNDEVDMYFPRKHFLTKFQMYNDLLDNILIKPIPVNRIIPPRLFPIPFVEGIPYEKKKSILLKDVKKEDLKEEEKDLTLKHKKDDVVLKVENEKEKEKENEENNDQKTSNSNPDNLIKNEEKITKADSFDKTDLKVEVDDDANLSDYDPDFDNVQKKTSKLTKQETDIIQNYLHSRLKLKEPTDFLFGDLTTMKMQEKLYAEYCQTLDNSLNEPIDLGERYKYNMKTVDNLHQMFNKFTAEYVEQSDETLNKVEEEVKNKFNVKFSDSIEIKQFQTSAFDSVKVSVSLDDYITKFKNKDNKETQSQLPEQSNIQQQTSTAQFDNKEQELNSNDLERKQSSSDNAFYKSQNFDFDNNMLYDSGDFANDEDDQFGSLSNEVFLNM
jgi:hypothetical protein